MDLFEYQANRLCAKYHVPHSIGGVATTARQAQQIAERIGVPVVVKAQVKVGGRGKAGGVKIARSAPEVVEHAEAIIGNTFNGHVANSVLVVQAADIDQEFYLSFLVDRTRRQYLAMCSTEGGVDIEQTAAHSPEKIAYVHIDPVTGLDDFTAKEIVHISGLPQQYEEQFLDIIRRLWEVFLGEDALLTEVNPLVVTTDGTVICLDSKITIDDNALYRHPDFLDVEDINANPLEKKALALGLNYVKLDGQVGIIGNGAGLVMSTLDVVAYAGEEWGNVTAANFLDIGGGASAQIMASGLEVILSDPQVRSIFVNVFGGITACDLIAQGIVQAVEAIQAKGEGITTPIIVRLDGNNAEQGREILAQAAIPFVELVDSMDDAASLAAQKASVGQ